MKKLIGIILSTMILGACTMAVPSKTHKSESKKAKQYQALREEMSGWVARGMKKHKITGLSIALVDGGEVVWAEGFGFADKANKRQADAHTLI